MNKAIQAMLAALLSVLATGASAQQFPSRPITLVSTYAAGSGNDIIARAVARGMSDALKQSVIVENRAGASGTIGMSYVARSKPDGYTLAMGGIGSVVLHPAVEGGREKFNPREALAPVALVAKGSPVLVVNASLGVTTLSGLVDLARKRQLTYGSPGVGSAMHLTGELMKQITGVPIVHVPYRGQGLVMNDVLSGTINFAFLDLPVVLPFASDKRVHIVATASPQRVPQMPNIPTTGELGYPKLVMENWYAVYAPKDTPKATISILTQAIQKSMALPDVKKVVINTIGLTPLAEGPQALEKQTSEDEAKWAPIAARLRK